RSYGNEVRSNTGTTRSYGNEERSNTGTTRSYGNEERSNTGTTRSYGNEERSNTGTTRSYGNEVRSNTESSRNTSRIEIDIGPSLKYVIQNISIELDKVFEESCRVQYACFEVIVQQFNGVLGELLVVGIKTFLQDQMKLFDCLADQFSSQTVDLVQNQMIQMSNNLTRTIDNTLVSMIKRELKAYTLHTGRDKTAELTNKTRGFLFWKDPILQFDVEETRKSMEILSVEPQNRPFIQDFADQIRPNDTQKLQHDQISTKNCLHWTIHSNVHRAASIYCGFVNGVEIGSTTSFNYGPKNCIQIGRREGSSLATNWSGVPPHIKTVNTEPGISTEPGNVKELSTVQRASERTAYNENMKVITG
ncbi:hypothetical protein WDU94_002829, partial [Cyamophila willieti]